MLKTLGWGLISIISLYFTVSIQLFKQRGGGFESIWLESILIVFSAVWFAVFFASACVVAYRILERSLS